MCVCLLSDPEIYLDLDLPADSLDHDDLRFNQLHGKNSTISPSGKTATRPNAIGEFNDAIVMSNRPLRVNELFEVAIDKMVDRWSGSIEAGERRLLCGGASARTRWKGLFELS